jgi:hypothetical protein
MKILWSSSLVLALSMAQAGIATEFPISIECQDNQPTGAKLKVELSLASNEAQLVYASTSQIIRMNIDKPYGIYSSSSVSVQSQESGDFQAERVLEIAAQKTIVMRVTNYAQFTLQLKQNAEGGYEATELTFRSGIDAFADTQEEGALSFKDMACVVTGL